MGAIEQMPQLVATMALQLPLLTRERFADLVGLTHATVFSMCDRGYLPTLHLSGAVGACSELGSSSRNVCRQGAVVSGAVIKGASADALGARSTREDGRGSGSPLHSKTRGNDGGAMPVASSDGNEARPSRWDGRYRNDPPAG